MIYGHARDSDPTERKKKSVFRRIQTEHLMLEQDKQKKIRSSQALEMEIRRLDMEKDRIILKAEEKRNELEKLFREIALLEAEGRRIRKKMDLLSH